MSSPLARQVTSLCVVIVGISALVLSGCDNEPSPTPRPSPTVSRPAPSPTLTEPPPQRGGTLTMRLAGDPSTLNPWLIGNDPHGLIVAGLLYSGLTRIDNRLQPQPDLAERWDVSQDGTVLTFYLRTDARWHDGRAVTPEDVVWSYGTIAGVAPDTPQLLRLQDTILGVEAVEGEERAVRLRLKRRYAPILVDLAVPILPSHLLSGTLPVDLAAHPFNDSPIGAGPFRFESRVEGQSVTLKAHGEYHGGAPALDTVALLVAPDDEVAEGAVRDGTLLFAQLPPERAERLVAQGPGIKGGAHVTPGYDFVAFNLRPGRPFNDTRLRRAWALALDKPGLVFAATSGRAEPVWSDVHPHSWAYSGEVPRLGGQPDEARRLIAEAGWADTNADGIVEKDGRPLQVPLYVRADDQIRRKAAEEMVEPLRRVGIDVRVEPADFETAIRLRLSPSGRQPFDFDVVMLGWSRPGFDPDPFALFHSSQIPTEASPGLLNFTGFAAPEYDSLILEARAQYDFEARARLHARMQQIISEELPYYFLWAEKAGVVASPKLRGNIDFASPRFMWNVERWWVEE